MGVKPAELDSFETQARRLRYRALGQACRDHKIRLLLLAHHDDDIAESMLQNILRLKDHPASWNLRAMHGKASNIPECWGMYGVCESGDQQIETIRETEIHKDHSSKADGRTYAKEQDSVQFEGGGVKVYRPLLSFSKAKIRITGQRYGLDWVEDETNSDVTKTTRNAIRYLLGTQRLPKAISKNSLLTLHDHAKQRIEDIEKRGQELFHRAKVLLWDIRSGRLVIRLPRQLVVDKMGSMSFLKGLFEMVSPQQRVPVSSLARALHYMFLQESKPQDKGHADEGFKFAISGVLAERREIPQGGPPFGYEYLDLDPLFTWNLTRAPFRRTESDSVNIPSLQHETLLLHSDTEASLSGTEQQGTKALWSAWKLWDGRFWIRMCNHTGQDLEVRAFSTEDWSSLARQLSHDEKKALRGELAAAAPGSVQYTLPVIAHIGRSGKICAFPTLHHRIGTLAHGLNWEVRYKYVDFRPATDMGGTLQNKTGLATEEARQFPRL